MTSWDYAFESLRRRAMGIDSSSPAITVKDGPKSAREKQQPSLKGGRGKKAPYEQTHMRVPLPLVPEVKKMVEVFRERTLQGDSPSTESVTPKDTDLNPQELIDLAHRMLNRKKSARLTLQGFLSELLGQEIDLSDRS